MNTEITEGHESLLQARKRSSALLQARVTQLEREVEVLRAQVDSLVARGDGTVLLRRGERVVIESGPGR